MSLKKEGSFWNERWKQLQPSEPTKRCDYYISDYGRIKSIEKETKLENFLKGSSLASGYRKLDIRLASGQHFSIYIHKFVAEKFIEKTNDEKIFVVHKDGDKKNNHWRNLEWLTRKELTQRQIKAGVYEPENRKRSVNTKMTESKVRLLKKRIKEGKTKKTILAKSFGITYMQLNRIERGENWGHVK